MPRAQTMPSLLDTTSREKTAPVLEPLKIDTASKEDESAVSEICLSPSWSDHGERKRKKEKKRQEREQRELEKNKRQEEEKQRSAEAKTGKRLSKRPPPAAMETQKMPSGLRRNSFVSFLSSRPSSPDNSRRNSRDERRLSGISFASFKPERRSQSTPASSDDLEATSKEYSEHRRPVVSPAAPRLPSFRWHSRKISSTTSKSISLESDDAYEKDLVQFAYRLEASAIVAEPEEISTEHKKPQQSSIQADSKRSFNHPAFGRSVTEPVLFNEMRQSIDGGHTHLPPAEWLHTYNSKPKIRQDETQAYRKQGITTTRAPEKASAEGSIETFKESNPSPSQDLPSPQRRPHLTVMSSSDGSSYVHKQRMYQQQQSIAGFEDQLAITAANELAAENEALLEEQQKQSRTQNDGRPLFVNTGNATSQDFQDHTRDHHFSHDSMDQRERDRASRSRPTLSNQHSQTSSSISQSDGQADASKDNKNQAKQLAVLKDARGSTSPSKPQVPAGSKTDRILGFRRRTKPPPSKIYAPEKEEQDPGQDHPMSPQVPHSTEPVVKRSKIERIFREPVSARVPHRSPKDVAKPQTTSDKDGQDLNEGPRRHSRTRTSSSQLFNGSLPSPVPLPRSMTTPVLITSSEFLEQSEEIKSDNMSHGKAQDCESTMNSPRSKPADVGSNARHTTNGASKIEPAPEHAISPHAGSAKNSEVNISKANSELVVESLNGEGIIRKTSITRPRSNPQLQTQTAIAHSIPSLDFLPQLKHQPLVKSKRHSSPLRPSIESSQFHASLSSAPTAYQSPRLSSNAPPSLALTPRSPLRPHSQFPAPTPPLLTKPRNHSPTAYSRSSTSITTATTSATSFTKDSIEAKPIAKLFVICCKCKFWHDLPSKLYEAMALPKELCDSKPEAEGVKGTGKARLETAVKCPWCEHAMTTWCCQGWTTVVYLHERHH